MLSRETGFHLFEQKRHRVAKGHGQKNALWFRGWQAKEPRDELRGLLPVFRQHDQVVEPHACFRFQLSVHPQIFPFRFPHEGPPQAYAVRVSFVDVLVWIGTLTFAATGALVALGKRFDLIGVLVLAAATAIGGGSIRDVIVGVLPPSNFTNEPLLWVVCLTALAVFFLPHRLREESRLLYVLDTLGLAVFAALGAERGVAYGMGMWGTIFAGAVSGVGGGVLRDVLSGRVPGIFYRFGDFYASAAALGALCYFLVQFFAPDYALAVSLLTTLAVRFGSRLLNLELPVPRTSGYTDDAPAGTDADR